jgi:hypothetical protein
MKTISYREVIAQIQKKLADAHLPEIPEGFLLGMSAPLLRLFLDRWIEPVCTLHTARRERVEKSGISEIA